MKVAVALALLALFDAALTGFRAAAGRDGRIDKRAYVRRALVRGVVAGAVVLAANAGLAAALVATAPDADAAWRELVRAGAAAVWVFGGFATVTLVALGLWFVPVPEIRLLPTVIVLGPLTLVRPLVIVGGLVVAATRSSEPRVWVIAAAAGISMFAIERLLGRTYTAAWRRLT